MTSIGLRMKEKIKVELDVLARRVKGQRDDSRGELKGKTREDDEREKELVVE